MNSCESSTIPNLSDHGMRTQRIHDPLLNTYPMTPQRPHNDTAQRTRFNGVLRRLAKFT